MPGSISITEQQIFAALVAVLGGFGLADSAGVPLSIYQGQINRVPEPVDTDFAVMWSLMREPLTLTVLTSIDVQGAGSITDNQLTAAAVTIGPVAAGQIVYGANVAAGCTILSQISGAPGGVGVYALTPTPNTGSQPFYSGVTNAVQSKNLTIQLDIHGPASAENAERVATLWRSQVGVSAFDALSFPGGPLYTSSPRQSPFINDQNQYEERWMVDLSLQVNPTVSTTQQFAAALQAIATNVHAAYPL